jgi:hypothetical protein
LTLSIAYGLSLALAAVLLSAGLFKVCASVTFPLTRTYLPQLAPLLGSRARQSDQVVACGEVALGAWLVISLDSDTPLEVSVAAFLIMSLLVINGWLAGSTGPCRCSGLLPSGHIGPPIAIRNLVLAMVGSIAIYLHHTQMSTPLFAARLSLLSIPITLIVTLASLLILDGLLRFAMTPSTSTTIRMAMLRLVKRALAHSSAVARSTVEVGHD